MVVFFKQSITALYFIVLSYIFRKYVCSQWENTLKWMVENAQTFSNSVGVCLMRYFLNEMQSPRVFMYFHSNVWDQATVADFILKAYQSMHVMVF